MATTTVQEGHPEPTATADAPVLAPLFGPNWFAAVMGTGIVATAAAGLPVQVPGQRTFALVVWLLAATLLAVLGVATAVHHVRHPHQARSYAGHPVMSHFYGAPPMAVLTVGAGALLVGRDLIGLPAALALDAVLWVAGTAAGLASAVLVPYLVFTRHRYEPESAFGGWLMPVVPPMVSATTGGFLLPHLPAGQVRATMLLACYAMFGMSLLASLVIIGLIWNRLVHHEIGDAAAVPTLWIVLGPLGQSMTAAGVLGGVAGGAVPEPYAESLQAFGVLHGVLVGGFAAMWLVIAVAVTVRTARHHLPFSLTWWSFTFPVGTLVTGTSALARETGLVVAAAAAVVLFALLLLAWVTVAVRTVRGLARGHLLTPPGPSPEGTAHRA